MSAALPMPAGLLIQPVSAKNLLLGTGHRSPHGGSVGSRWSPPAFLGVTSSLGRQTMSEKTNLLSESEKRRKGK